MLNKLGVLKEGQSLWDLPKLEGGASGQEVQEVMDEKKKTLGFD